MSVRTTWLCCGALRTELEELHRIGKITGKLLFFDSLLHLNPAELETTLTAKLERVSQECGRMVLVYGDCCPRILNLERQYGVGRVNAINCAQMLVGRARYRELMLERAFFLLAEWALRWKEIFQIGLGLTMDVAHDLMQNSHGRLVYLDTGLVPVPRQVLADCAAYTGLSWRIERITLDPLLELLLEAQASSAVFSPKQERS